MTAAHAGALVVREVPEAELEAVLAALHPLAVEAQPVDQPYEPPPTLALVRSHVLTPWYGDPVRLLVAERAGVVCGAALVELPSHDNPHLATVELLVALAERRRGVGRGLWEAVLAVTRDEGRRAVTVEARTGSPVAAFLTAVGATPRLEDVRRHQPIAELDLDRIEALRVGAARAAQGYRLEAWAGSTPEHLRAAVAAATEALNDAPLGELDHDDERWDADRVQARDRGLCAAGLRLHCVLALAPDGEPAGLTDVVVSEDGTYAWQWGTAVAPAHRGHRLGMLLKTTMVERLRAQEPALQVVSTWNADSNDHMIAVNDALGYVPVDSMAEWQLDLPEEG